MAVPYSGTGSQAEAVGQLLGVLGNLWLNQMERDALREEQKEEARARHAEREEALRKQAMERDRQRRREHEKQATLNSVNNAIDRELARNALNAQIEAELAMAGGQAATAGDEEPLPVDIGAGSGRNDVFPAPAAELPEPENPGWRSAFHRLADSTTDQLLNFIDTAGQKGQQAWETTRTAVSDALDGEAFRNPGDWLADHVGNDIVRRTVRYTEKQIDDGVEKVQEQVAATKRDVDIAMHGGIPPGDDTAVGAAQNVQREAIPVNLMNPFKGRVGKGMAIQRDLNQVTDAGTRMLDIE